MRSMDDRRIRLGYVLSCEEHGPRELVGYARLAEAAGFDYATISDHFHPWLDEQGSSPFAWTVLGGVAEATTSLPVATAVTCPTFRYHPAIVAQASATAAAMFGDRFTLGVGTGENLNEHVTGTRWPPWEVRGSMLEEAVEIIRRLWTGEWVTIHGRHYTVENARLYTLPAQPPDVIVAAAGPRSARLAGRIGDALINFTPDPDVARTFAEHGGEGKPCYVQLSVCWAESTAEALETAFRICRNVALTGELGNQLPHPRHFAQATENLTPDDVGEVIVCGPDVEAYVERIIACADAGYPNVHLYQVGDDQEGFFRFVRDELLPRLP
jgi:coenzyme F420-dependent glucose-6-phosphate dehydrogenase